MDLKTLSLAAVAALLALPAVAAGPGPDVTVTADPDPVDCQTARLDAEDRLGPGVHTRTDVWFDDCEASVAYHGNAFVAACGRGATVGPAAVASDCAVTADL